MRKVILALTLSALSSTAFAAGVDETGLYRDASDYSAKVYYRLDFSSSGIGAHTVGLRFDNRYTAPFQPDVLQARFTANAAPVVKLQGFAIRGHNLAAAQGEGGYEFWNWLSPMEWLAIGGTLVVTGAAISHNSGKDTPTTGTGGA